MKKRLGIVLCLAVVIGGLLAAGAAARDEASQPATVGIDVTVWQRIRDGAVFVSTRPPGGNWKTHQTPIDLSALSSSGAFHQGSPVSIDVTIGGGVTARVDVTVWRRISDSALFVSTRPQGAGWKTHQTPIDMSKLSRSRAFYQGSAVSVAVTLTPKRHPASDRDVLVTLYHATDGPNWRDNTNWLSNRPLSHWHGVSTDSAGRVIYLSLPDNRLSGTIPSELGELSNLKWLMLNGNQLSGTIPPQLGNLANLEILWLQSNLLSGTIPRELGNLGNLQQVVLWLNQLMGCVPEALQYVSDYCGFPLPHAGDREALVALYQATDGPNWHDNTGWLSDRPLPKWYGVHTDDDGRVIRLELERNQLRGELPPELGALSRLTELRLQKNQLRGEIPRELGDLSNLKLLWLHSNQLSGTIPGELGNLSRLTWLGLQNNKLTGCVPPALRLPSRSYCVAPPIHAADRAALVALYHATDGPNWRDNTNWLSDSPEWYGVRTDHAGRVQRLYLRENQLRGELPPELGALTRLDSLDFDHNVALNGPLPESLAGIASLWQVTLNGTGLCAPADDGFQRWLLNLRSWSGAICPSTSPTQTTGGVVVRDIFGRAVNETGIVLVDWEGYIANPAMRYFIELPGDVPRPARVALSASESRMYFGLPSSIGKHGPAKVVEFADAFSDGGFYVSIFPDRDTSGEEHSLTIRYLDSQGRVNVQTIDVRVIDQDIDRPLDFNIILDFSNDRIGMYDREFREVIQQAADDFAYFIGDMHLDEIAAGEARIWISNPGGYDTGRTVTNSFAYTGTLIHVYDQQHPGITPSGVPGEPSHSSNGVEYLVKGSGVLHFDPRGVFKPHGYTVSYPDSEWWTANKGDGADVYGTTIHEMGHTLIFYGGSSNGHPGFAQYSVVGEIWDPAVVAYHGAAPALDHNAHLVGTFDVASRRGGYGNERGGPTPYAREILTKSHMLIAQAIGYTLRDTSPFRPLAIIDEPLAEGRVGAPYAHTLTAAGGIPAYHWAIASGRLPRGLSLDSFTGAITGTPSEAGRFTFTVRVRDNTEGHRGVTQTVTLTVR